MDIETICSQALKTANKKGWTPRSVGEDIALMHSELSEALEVYRSGQALDLTTFNENGKPEGYLSELADVIIRIGHHVAQYKLTSAFDAVIMLKMQYNETRPNRHGGKVI